MRPAALGKPLGRCFQHQPLRDGYAPQLRHLVSAHDAGIEMRQQAGLLDYCGRCGGQVRQRRFVAERRQFVARGAIAQFGFVAEREQSLAASCRRAGARRRQHLFE